MKQRDLFQLAPAVTTDGGTTETRQRKSEPAATPTWPEAKWDDEGELAFAE